MNDIKESFLYEFTKELILNSAPAYVRDKETERELKMNEIKEKIDTQLSLDENKEQTFKNSKTITNTQNIQIDNRKKYLNRQDKPISPIPEYNQPATFENKRLEGLYFGKIQNMVYDQNVVSIECPGPGKFIIISTITKIIPTKIMLSKNEINSIIESFSQEARIPRIGGVFKAIVNNLIITAIDSEFAGPRFIISKIRGSPSQFFQ
ncbi:MAG: hypothetical protein QXI33_01625 [Candidatus Pacearchaeota archaeon]